MNQLDNNATSPIRVGMIGLGMMGSAIAKNIRRRGFPLTVLAHRSRSAVERLVSEGASEARSASELAAQSDILVISVTGTDQVRAVLWNDVGVMDGAHSGLVVMDTSTCDPLLAREADDDLACRGARYLDAPVNRTPKEAEEGRLNSLVGGDAKALEFARPVMESYSESIHHLGAVGSGYRAKLIHNFISQANITIIAEAMCTAAKVGLDLNEFISLCGLSGAHSKAFDRVTPYLLSGDDSGQRFALRNAAKDMWSYSQLAASYGSTAIVAEAVRQTYVLATQLGYGDQHVPHLFDVLGELNNVRVSAMSPPESSKRSRQA
ncbi:NAD(P)-dependent oxidoreductase [Caballeronia sordidicola]|uniref:3-hydroxyisobutyrate dehydrogenase n=1 Tax=Caballeronia sordidicola TaxID=196367 RepID=A0A226X009_CABSO|nr:NAD(P)-dependent oxidoreductase [Caballeronia sordidicola]OXC76776.1 3-hydroxyisobutyrate dehydrogenase [Caballeronia sordidicola]